MDISSAIEEGERYLARVWKWIAASGVVAIAFGVVLLVWPDIGLSAMVGVVGAFALVNGLMYGVAAFVLPRESRQNRAWLAVAAVAGTVSGVIVLLWPDLSAKALLYVIAAWAIAVGVTHVVAAVALPLDASRAVLLALNGIVLAAFGAVMFIEPGEGAVALLALIAAFAIVRGVFDIAFALELRRLRDEVRQRMGAPVGARPVVHG